MKILRRIVSVLSTFFYQIKQGIVGIFRNSVMSLGSVLALVSCMIILGTFFIVLDIIDQNFKTTDLQLMELYIDESLDQDGIDAVNTGVDSIKNTSGELKGIIESSTYHTKEENWETFIAKYSEDDESGASDIFSLFQDNIPLPASITVRFTSFSDMSKLYQLRYELSKLVGSDNVKDNLALYEKITNVKNAITVTGIWILAILIVVSLFIIMNTVKLGVFARKDEIMFMRYCGATKRFIRTPFVIEGIVIGLFSAAVATALQYYVYSYIITDVFKEYAISSSINDFSHYSLIIIIAFAVIGLLTGTIGSSLSIKKYLKV